MKPTIQSLRFVQTWRNYLQQKNQTQASLAIALNIQPARLSRLVHGKERWHRADLQSACELLRLSKDQTAQLLQLAGLMDNLMDDDSALSQPNYTRPMPLELPARVQHFCARENNEIAVLAQQLAPGKVVTLWGPKGVGKSALAIELLHHLVAKSQLLKQFPDGVIWLDFYHQPTADAALQHLTWSLGGNHTENAPHATYEATRRALANKHVLIVGDGAEEAENLSRVLDVCPFTCGILLTTIRPEQGYGDYVHRVDPLPSGIAYKVLRRWSGHNADNDPSVDAICRLAGNLPLALRIAGSYIRSSGMKPSEYVELLSINGLAALTLEDRNRQSIGRLIGRTIQMLSEGAYRVLGAVGMLAPGPFADITIAAAVDAPAQQVQQWLNELVRYSLLIRVEQPVGVNHARWYQVVHSLIYWYAQASDLAPTGAAQRLAVYYAAQMNVALNTTPVPVAWLASEREHWVAVLDACHSASAWQALWQLAEPLEEYFDRQGLDPMRVKVCEQALAAVRALHQRKAEAYWLNLLGLAQKRIGNIHAACSMFTHGLEISREVDDRRLEAVCLNNLGITYRLLGRVELSITHNQQALEIDRDIENRRGMGHDLKGLGEAYADAGNLDQALVAYSHALLLLHETGERREEAFCLIRLGQAQIILGHWEVAIEHLQAALLISRQVNDRLSEHESLTYLGKVYAAQGDEQMAKFYAQLAAEVMHEIGRLDL